MKSKCYLLKQGSYGSSYCLGVFLYKKDAVTAAKEGGHFKHNKKDDLYEHHSHESEYRSIVELPFCDKHRDGSDLLFEL